MALPPGVKFIGLNAQAVYIRGLVHFARPAPTIRMMRARRNSWTMPTIKVELLSRPVDLRASLR